MDDDFIHLQLHHLHKAFKGEVKLGQKAAIFPGLQPLLLNVDGLLWCYWTRSWCITPHCRIYCFGAYFNILPGSEWSALMLTYGFPLSIIGMALKYAELKPVPCLTYSDAQLLREKCATPILKQLQHLKQLYHALYGVYLEHAVQAQTSGDHGQTAATMDHWTMDRSPPLMSFIEEGPLITDIIELQKVRHWKVHWHGRNLVSQACFGSIPVGSSKMGRPFKLFPYNMEYSSQFTATGKKRYPGKMAKTCSESPTATSSS
ncbi:hypothetical protein L2E82_49996 [Cichorium intybus]|nr:hypothetical protein L2E82_49996 [Cichorium intybus]